MRHGSRKESDHCNELESYPYRQDGRISSRVPRDRVQPSSRDVPFNSDISVVVLTGEKDLG
jgi:hypothetical protein